MLKPFVSVSWYVYMIFSVESTRCWFSVSSNTCSLLISFIGDERRASGMTSRFVSQAHESASDDDRRQISPSACGSTRRLVWWFVVDMLRISERDITSIEGELNIPVGRSKRKNMDEPLCYLISSVRRGKKRREFVFFVMTNRFDILPLVKLTDHSSLSAEVNSRRNDAQFFLQLFILIQCFGNYFVQNTNDDECRHKRSTSLNLIAAKSLVSLRHVFNAMKARERDSFCGNSLVVICPNENRSTKHN